MPLVPDVTKGRAARLAEALRVYADWRMAKILLIGFVSGFPWVLIGSMITLWLQEEGFSRSGIGLFGLVSKPLFHDLLYLRLGGVVDSLVLSALVLFLVLHLGGVVLAVHVLWRRSTRWPSRRTTSSSWRASCWRT